MRDPVELEVFKNLYHSIAEEMGAALRRTSFSPNIKERRDYSCAVFDSAGQVIAMGDHMPVHLGSMPMSVAAAVGQCELEPGDVVMLNDPFRGGTHLPDITLVMPVHLSASNDSRVCGGGALPRRDGAEPRHHTGTTTPDFYVASRAHHADVGGTYPGSMGPCREIYQEGLRIPPVKIMRGGKLVADVLALLLNNVRTPEEREGDLGAQIAACQTGAQRLREICDRYGMARAKRAAADLLGYSEEMMRAFLRTIPPGHYQADDFLDDDGVEDKPVRIAVTIHVKASSSRKSPRPGHHRLHRQRPASPGRDQRGRGHHLLRVFLCLPLPAPRRCARHSGLMRPIRVIAPSGTVVNARPPAAVAGGNVETSQRIVDVLLKALAQAIPDRIPAAAAGTMNNLTIGGIDPRTGEPFAYYETIAGGMGARCTKDGVSGVHTHMTNSLNTPAEALEYAYPIRLRQYSFRPRSGGAGLHSGGDGIVREIEVLTDAQVTLLADRRSRGPYGLAGGADGAPGRTLIIRRDGSAEEIPGKTSVRLRSGERVRMESPGGGGWGRPKP